MRVKISSEFASVNFQRLLVLTLLLVDNSHVVEGAGHARVVASDQTDVDISGFLVLNKRLFTPPHLFKDVAHAHERRGDVHVAVATIDACKDCE